ncbi:hypothetical protein QBC47DRAFT_387040 [Echria macrotheca]|uniref:Ubiquitin-like domain-containing protein n=1 Tax=Echria macrotheca TaxID=438768 RepID=A0AAJ0BB10_9PEZI|nr:hypothetical protein QBC47DRAFT_387040 [Echria macrotheca]
MAAPAFGFSAGDFISAVKLVVDVSEALKATGGASASYRDLLTELELLQDILLQLQARQSGSNVSNPLRDYGRRQAELTLSTLSQFLELISKFAAKLGPDGSPKWYRHVGRKAQWAVAYAGEVEKLRLRIGTQLHALNLLVQLEDRSSPFSDQILAALRDIDAQNKAILQQNDRSASDIGRLKSLTSDLELVMEIGADHSVPGKGKAVVRCTCQYTDRSLNWNANVSDTTPPHGEASSSGSSSGSGSSSKQRDRQLAYRNGAVARQNRDIELLHKHPCSCEQRAHISLVLDDTIPALLSRLLHLTTRDLRALIIKLWLSISQFMVFIHAISTGLGKQPMLAVADSISFEDALGRHYILQHTFYNHWPNFQAFLNRQFQDCPGKRFISDGHYYLLGFRAKRLLGTNNADEWKALAKPGSKISMSLKLRSLSVGPATSVPTCPWPACGAKTRTIEAKDSFWCGMCGTTYFLTPRDDPERTRAAAKELNFEGQRRTSTGRFRFVTPCQRPRKGNLNLDTTGIAGVPAVFRKIHLDVLEISPRIREAPDERSRLSRERRSYMWFWYCCVCSPKTIRARRKTNYSYQEGCQECGHLRCDSCEGIESRPNGRRVPLSSYHRKGG